MKCYFVIISIFFSATIFAQEILTNNSILEMKKLGLSNDVIVSKIISEQSKFDVSTQALVSLKEQGISDEVLAVMVQQNSDFRVLASSEEKMKEAKESEEFYLTSIEYKDEKLILNKNIELQKGDKLQVFLPYNLDKDFHTIEPKAGLLSMKNIGAIADIVSTGAMAVLVGSNDLGTSIEALKVMQKAETVRIGKDFFDKIDKLPFSKKTKKIAGKIFEITKIKTSENDGVEYVEGTIEKKKYLLSVPEAFILGEVKLMQK